MQLDLSGTDCQLESVFGALLYGCTNNLVHLNLSRNQFSSPKKSSKDLCVPASVKKFFSTAIFLRTINLSHCKLPPEVLKAVLLGLACNESANDIRLDLSSNDFKEKGAAVLELALTDIRCISGLDLSDNALDMELVGVVGAIAKNKSIKHLSIGKNFNNIKAKYVFLRIWIVCLSNFFSSVDICPRCWTPLLNCCRTSIVRSSRCRWSTRSCAPKPRWC